jgi:hypothetical protein
MHAEQQHQEGVVVPHCECKLPLLNVVGDARGQDCDIPSS